MADLLVNHPSGASDNVPLTRLRITIGRSARSDVCIPDAFAARLHAEVRQEGDAFWLHDLGSANGTRYNGIPVKSPLQLQPGGEIQIGETKIVFNDDQPELKNISSTLIADSTRALDPTTTVSLAARKNPTSDILDSSFSSRTDLLGLISKVGVALLSSSGLDETLNQVASLVFQAVPAERVIVMLRNEKSDEGMEIKVARVRGRDEPISEVRISRTIMNEVIENGKSVLTSDAQQDPRFASQTLILQGIRSVLAVPLSVTEHDVFGIIYADSPTTATTFKTEHLDILTTLASVAAITPLQDAIVSVNQYLAENTPANRFVTLFVAELEPATGKLRYINAGHNPPLVGRSDGSIEQLSSGGLPLGIMPFAEYEVGEILLNRGDVLTVYSDGVSEANNLAEEEFGLDRLTNVLKNTLKLSASAIRDKVESALSEFTGTAPANDDITLVIVKKL